MALTANVQLEFQDEGHELRLLVGADDIFYQGALLNFNTAGYIKVGTLTRVKIIVYPAVPDVISITGRRGKTSRAIATRYQTRSVMPDELACC